MSSAGLRGIVLFIIFIKITVRTINRPNSHAFRVPYLDKLRELYN